MKAYLLCLLSFSFTLISGYCQEYTVYEFPSKFSEDSITFLASHSDYNGFIWVATTNGVLRFDGSHYESFSSPLSRVPTFDFITLPTGEFLAITQNGLIQIRESILGPQFTKSPLMNGLVYKHPFRGYKGKLVDSRKGIWIIRENKILRCHENKWDVFSTDSLKKSDSDAVVTLLEDPKQNVWLVMDGCMLYLFDFLTDKWQEIPNPTSLTSIESAIIDPQGKMILSGDGVSTLFPQKGK